MDGVCRMLVERQRRGEAVAQPFVGRSTRRGGDTGAGETARRLAAYAGRPWRNLAPAGFVALLLWIAYVGWRANDEGHLTPEKGLGYWLGIIGSLAMLALLLYPLRKRLARTRFLGSTAAWFRLHMMLGLLGPTLVLVHCAFKSSSLNATVALVAMLIVSGSGLVGRYLYGRVHLGLYGRKAQLQEILADRDRVHQALGRELPHDLNLFRRLEEHGRRSLQASALAKLLLQRSRSRRLQRRLIAESRAAIRQQARIHGWARRERAARLAVIRQHLGLYFAATDKAAALDIFDRLLSAWHVAHLPMFFLMVLAAIVHVIAVHLY